MKKKVSIQLKLNKRSVSSLDSTTQEQIKGGSYGCGNTGGSGGSGGETNNCPQSQQTCYTYTYPNPTYWWDCVYGW